MKDRFRNTLGNLRIWIFACTGGILFAAFDRCGYMIQHYGTLWAISENPLHKTIFHRILLRLPVMILAVLLLLILLDAIRERQKWKKGIRNIRWEIFCRWKYWPFLMWGLYFISFLPAFLSEP